MLYGYGCNKKKVKFGSSFSNKNGQKPKSHKTFVPNLALSFVVYSSIKKRFKIKDKGEFFNCKINELEKFVFYY